MQQRGGRFRSGPLAVFLFERVWLADERLSGHQGTCQYLSSVYVYGLDALRVDRPYPRVISNSLWSL